MSEYPSTWRPNLEKGSGPKYERIVHQIAVDISSGVLGPGDQLPTQRALAAELGVTVGTVARAYSQAQKLGLLGGEVGRGTFVAEHGAQRSETSTDLSLNLPLDNPVRDRLMKTLSSLGVARSDLLLYRKGSRDRDREAALRWLEIGAATARPDEILITAGAQHGLFLSLATLCSSGDTVLCEAITHPGLRLAASSLGLELVGIDFDGEKDPGTAITRQIEATGARTICLTPILQNPTTRTLNEAEMAAVAEAIDRGGLQLIEDDVYRMLRPGAPEPLWNRLPNGVLVTSISKSITAGLRVGYLAARGETRDRLERAIYASTVMISGLNVEMANSLILDSNLEMLLESHRERIAERHSIVARLLPGVVSEPHGLHCWLRLPDRWSAAAFASQCRGRDIVITPSAAFAVAKDEDDHVRISLGGDRSLREFESAIERIADLLGTYPTDGTTVI